jgi:signal recognition particle GTPase
MRFRGDILSVTSRGVETVLVTGTNGKTTTAGMLAHAMEKAGRPVICNRAGANLLSGVTAEFTAGAPFWEQVSARWGRSSKVMEITERTGPKVCGTKMLSVPTAMALSCPKILLLQIL